MDPADHAQEIFSRIREMQAKPAAILLTHGHYDHILAVEDVKKNTRFRFMPVKKKQGLFWILPQICPDTETAPVP